MRSRDGTGEIQPIETAGREEGRLFVRPYGFSASVTGEVNDRAEPARHSKRIYIQMFDAAVSVDF
ncbi:hypothetical protein NL342_28445, partial [Klebsiella pneumoniae]|nr:hypothetical protein [Klebsiella pneumoniae]